MNTPPAPDDSGQYALLPMPSAEDTNLVTPEERARWEGNGKKSSIPLPRPLLSDDGRKGPVSGARWENHDIGDLLGEGGMAAVYLAKRRSDDQLVALKILPARFADDAASRKRFEREAQLSQLIVSDHVVKVFSAGRFGPLCYLEMEYVDGGTLADIVKKRREAGEKPFTANEVIDIAMQTSEGLKQAAEHKLVHRDIKPANIMRTHSGLVKIADFGIVKVIGEEALTMAGTTLGTPTYMSPEQGRGDQVDARADIYALGVVLYELLTLKTPFEEATADALIYQHHFVEPQLISTLALDCPAHLQAIVFKCLQKYPDKRYADAGQLLRDLDLIRHGHAPEFAVFSKNRVTTGAAEALARHGGGWRRWWKSIAVGTAALITLLALGIWWMLAMRAETDVLRGRLTVLDTPQAIPVSVSDDLTRLQRYVGDGDPQVQRWNNKLAQAKTLRDALNELPDKQLSHQQALLAEAHLRAYQELCGSSEPLVTTWRERLAQRAETVNGLRAQAAVLERSSDTPTQDRVQQAQRALNELAPLLASDDVEVARWMEQTQAAQKTIDDLRKRLERLDSSEVITLTLQREAQADLTRWAVIMGAAETNALRWKARLTTAQEQTASLRTLLRQLDQGTILSLKLFNSLETEFATYTAIVGPDDQDLIRWNARIAASTRLRGNLVRRLRELDTDAFITQEELTAHERDLAQLRLVFDDATLVRGWAAQISELNTRIAAQREVVSSLTNKDSLSYEEQQLLRTTANELVDRKVLSVEESERFNQRLALNQAQLLVLSEQLSVLDRVEDVSENLRDELQQFERLAAADDNRRTVWRRKFDQVVLLRRRLSALDEQQSPATSAEEDLKQLTNLIGSAPADVRRWQDKLTNIETLKNTLRALDQVGPIPHTAPSGLDRLVVLVGETDSDIQRWQNKLDQFTSVRNRLAVLDQALILPAQAHADVQALENIVGSDDDLVQRAKRRIELLNGPPQPHWAQKYYRDAFGLCAETTIGDKNYRFRYIPAGIFRMGSSVNEVGRDNDENGVTVTLSQSYWLADSECAQALWSTIMLDNPAWKNAPAHPVERVSWEQTQLFLTIFSRRLPGNPRCRLPTEAEWEYAARAGDSGMLPGHDQPLADEIDRVAVHRGISRNGTLPCRTRLPNRLGLYDVLGNVWEWCQDGYGSYPVADVTDQLLAHGSERVIRGGSWGDKPELLRVADRHRLGATVNSAYVGFRILIDVEWKP
jgi:formylglycine-generating enzyme required for sulfatase activity